MGHEIHFPKTGGKGLKWDIWERFDKEGDMTDYQWVCFNGVWYPPRQRTNWPRLLRMFHDGHVEWGAKVQRVQDGRYKQETLVVVNGLTFG